jgi:carbon monoxide dehydrogenase subunit G
MLHFEGDRDVPGLPAELWAKLRDARFLVRCIPGAEAVADAELDRAVCTIRPGLSFVRGTLEVTIRVAEAVEPSTVRLALHSKGVGSSSDVEAVLTLTAHGGGTRVHWTADVQSLGGLLRAIPQGLIRGAAAKVIDDVWSGMVARLAEQQARPGPAAPETSK